MSSRPEHPTHSTGAHRSRGDDRRRSRPQPAERPAPPTAAESGDGHQPYLDGLFTYCLSVLCDHDAATTVLGEVLALAERHHTRRPADPVLHRSWFYALARWACLRRLAERTGPDAGRSGRREGSGARRGDGGRAAARRPDTGQRQRELAALAWPEAAGTTPEQREALELSVRHRLSADEVAAVLGADPIATRALLATASCEVERTRAALAVVESGRCREVARLAGDSQLLLGAALSRELVRHVDDCAECRRSAERATVPGTWPGTAPVAQGALPLVGAPREAVAGALAAARRSRSGRAEGVPGAGRGGRAAGANGSPRYDRSGFPVGAPTDRAARRRRLRARALTTTVVATVVAAPVLALWAAYREAPATGEAADSSPSVTASEHEAGPRLGGRPYENAGNARTTPVPGFTAGDGTPDVSVEVVSADGTPVRPGGAAGRSQKGPGRLTVAAQPSGRATLITLSASGGTPVHWTASPGAAWLQLSRTAGSLRPGETATITIYVDHDREPAGHWRARVAIEPGGTAVTMEGYGATGPAPGHPHGPGPTRPTPVPSHPTHPTHPGTPTPTHPAPTPTPTSPTPSPTPTASTPKPSSTPFNTTRPAR
ncbi:sigma-70 family RNA polymerase sigma factor [Streptomyces sp. NPDC020742]|uniref:sigma-70 family RNA polymerase sigma factor n=1 Tax=Streptomyces sp. NPDC020742 TaxID=3154897 RepID=UPI0033FC88D1